MANRCAFVIRGMSTPLAVEVISRIALLSGEALLMPTDCANNEIPEKKRKIVVMNKFLMGVDRLH